MSKKKPENSSLNLDDVKDVTDKVGDEAKKAFKESNAAEMASENINNVISANTGILLPDQLTKAVVDKVADKTIDTVSDTVATTAAKKKPRNEDNEDNIDDTKKDINESRADVGRHVKLEDQKFSGRDYAAVAANIMGDIVEKGAARREAGITGLVSDTVNAAKNIVSAPVTLAKGAVDEVKNVASMVLGEARPTLTPLPDTLRPMDGIKWAMEKLLSTQTSGAIKEKILETVNTNENTNTNKGPG